MSKAHWSSLIEDTFHHEVLFPYLNQYDEDYCTLKINICDSGMLNVKYLVYFQLYSQSNVLVSEYTMLMHDFMLDLFLADKINNTYFGGEIKVVINDNRSMKEDEE